MHCWNNMSCPARSAISSLHLEELGNYKCFSFLIAVVSFVLAAIAYWRAGGKQDVENAKRELEREIEALRAKQKDLTENVLQRIAQAYEREQTAASTCTRRFSSG